MPSCACHTKRALVLDCSINLFSATIAFENNRRKEEKKAKVETDEPFILFNYCYFSHLHLKVSFVFVLLLLFFVVAFYQIAQY